MRKKTFILITTLLLVGGAVFSLSKSAYADGSVVAPATVTPNADGTATATITGTLSAADMKVFSGGGAYSTISLQYDLIKDNMTTTTKPTLVASCTDPDGSNKFSCTITNLAVGTYFYEASIEILVHDSPGGGSVVPQQSIPFFSGYRQFTVTSDSAGQLAVSFGSVGAITPHVPGPNNGYDFTVTMNVSHLVDTTPMSLVLGTATQNGNTSTYTCTPASNTSAPVTVPSTTANTPAPVIFQLSSVPDGNYCVSVQESLAGGLGSAPTGVGLNGNFFTDRGSIIHVGNAAPLAPNATNAQGANPTGCVINSDNSNYCMLAPLPGLGDGSGNLPVTSFGNYISTIIYIVFGLIGVLSVFMIVFGGIEYMTGTSAGEKEGGKSRITNAILGLLLALCSYIILNTINPKLVNLGVTIPQVAVVASTTIDNPPTGTGTTTSTITNTTYTTLCPQVGGTVNVTMSSDGGTTKSTVAYPIVTGFIWPSDSGVDQTITWGGKSWILYGGTERTTLTNAGISFNASNPTTVGAYKDGVSVTSVYGLTSAALSGLTSLEGACGAGCVVVTGGTECWDHQTHGPGLAPVDLRVTPALISYIQKGSGGQTLVVGNDYTVGSTDFYYEDAAHFHVRSW